MTPLSRVFWHEQRARPARTSPPLSKDKRADVIVVGGPVELEYFWPGLIGVSKDLLPLAARDAARPAISFVSGATGLAWAAALGRYMAEKLQWNRSDYDTEFDPNRHFTVGSKLQRLIGRPAAFALSNGIVKSRR